MKLFIPIAAIIAVASAGQIYNSQSNQPSAEVYQSALELQQHSAYTDQSQLTGHDVAYQGRPLGEKSARILSHQSEHNGHSYQYSYETENGIKAQEAGQVTKGTQAHGGYSYAGDDGQIYTVTYTADEHGFHPQGAHLPTPPPIPEAILKALEQNANDEANGIFDDGHYKEQHQPAIQNYQQYDASYQQGNYHSAPIQVSSGADSGHHYHK